MPTTWKKEILPVVLLAGMFVFAAVTWSSAPERIPVHWSYSGRPDRYGGRFEGLLLLPLMALGVYVLMLVLPRLDPGRANYRRFTGAYYAIRIALVALLAILDGLWQAAIRHPGLNVVTFVPMLVGLLFIVLGRVLGRVRPNWFVGIRTPWTLSSERSWTRTHRLGGRLFLALGLLLLPSGFLGRTYGLAVLGGGLAAVVLTLFAYSYVVWRGDPKRVPPAGGRP